MPRSIRITIPEPCAESWAFMTPAEQGRHCAACTKTVIDFSRLTDAEVLAYLSRVKGPSCGRFRAEQLNRPLREAPVAWAPQRWAAAALAVLGLGAAAPAVAQQPLPQTLTQQTMTMGMVATNTPPVLPDRVMRGRVTATSGQGLSGVTVLVEGTQHGTSTRADGSYELELPVGMSAARLVFSSIGFKTTTISSSQAEMVSLEASYDMLMGLVVTKSGHWYTPRGLWQRLTRPFRR